MLASQAIVSVCDTGVGIPEEHISKIFERFYQTDNSSSFTLGTGIGLALAKGIMNMHHGKIDVESTVGKVLNSRYLFLWEIVILVMKKWLL